MIYLVTKQTSIFEDNSEYTIISPEESKEALFYSSDEYIQFDSETGCDRKDPKASSLDPHTGYLLCTQFGIENDQFVIDNGTISPLFYKDIYEKKKLVGWNLLFDSLWLFKYGIAPRNVWDGMIAEQVLHLGEDHSKNATYNCIDPIINPIYNRPWTQKEYNMYLYSLDHKFALKTAAWNYLKIEMDKSVRGEINNEGLSTRVIKYAAGDVTNLNKIRELQLKKIQEEDLLKAVEFENNCVVPLSYLTYCGTKIDKTKWLAKCTKEKPKLAESALKIKQDILEWYNEHKAETIDGRPYVYRTYTIEGADNIKKEWNIRADNEIPRDAERDQHLFEDKIIFKWKVPFGRFELDKVRKKNKFIPYVLIDNQGDLFSGFSPELKVNDNLNIESSQQIIPLLTIIGVKCRTIDKKSHEEKDSFGKSVIALNADKFKIVKDFKEYKDLAKQLNSFGEKFLNIINPKTGRIHASWHQLGTRTGRLSSSGPNLQQLPSDTYTRSCFIAKEGYKWISADYQSQESRLIASISGDKECIKLFNEGCGDMHSLVAKISYPEIVKDCPIEEIKEKFHEIRQDAKKIEFAINYSGDYNTIANNMSMPLKRAKEIYANYMSGLVGVAAYQEYCKKAVLEKGYITLNPLTGHKAYWWDYQACMKAQDLILHKDLNALKKFNNKLHYIQVENIDGTTRAEYLNNIMDFTNVDLVKKKISDWKKRSVNFRKFVCGFK